MLPELTDEERRQLDPVVDALMAWRGDGTQAWNDLIAAWNDLIAAVERILTAREAAAERRGAVNALREAATDHRGPVTFYCRGTAGGTARENTDVADWLRDRADRIEAGDD